MYKRPVKKHTIFGEFWKKDHTNCSLTILYLCGELNQWPPMWRYRLTNEEKKSIYHAGLWLQLLRVLYIFTCWGFYDKCLVYGDFRKDKHTILSPKCIIHVLLQFPLNCSVNFLLMGANTFKLKMSKCWWCDIFTEWKLNKVIIWELIMWYMEMRLLA